MFQMLGDYSKLQTEMDGLLQSLHDMERELKLRKERVGQHSGHGIVKQFLLTHDP